METKNNIKFKIKPVYFCDKCDKKIITKKSLREMGGMVTGKIILNCSDPNCKHPNVIQKAPKKEEDGNNDK